MFVNWRVLNGFFSPDGIGGGSGGAADSNGASDAEASEGDKGAGTTITLTEKELQSRLDRAVTQAVETRERKLAEEHKTALEQAERAKLEAEGNYKALAEKFQGDLDAERQARAQADLRVETANLLVREQMSAFSALFDKDLSTLQGRAEAVALLKAEVEKTVAAQVEEAVKKRLASNDLPPGGKHRAAGGQPDLLSLYPSMHH